MYGVVLCGVSGSRAGRGAGVRGECGPDYKGGGER